MTEVVLQTVCKMEDVEDYTQQAIKEHLIIETWPVEGHPVFIGVRLTRWKESKCST
jgi:hypothetical protein